MIKFNLIYYNPDIKEQMDNIFDFDLSSSITRVLNYVNDLLNIEDDHVVSYIMVNNEIIHEINKTYRSIDRPTDVISFAEIDNYKDKNNQITFIPYELGDIYISYEKVLSQSIDYNHSILREFSFLITHGILHLLGYDHMKKEDEEIMFSLQDKILNYLKIFR